MNSNELSSNIINASEVPAEERLHVLPRRFGRHMIRVEQAVFSFMHQLSREYHGGYWNYFELSNGGFYMALAQSEGMNVRVDTNDFVGHMSSDAAGITACLFAFSHLSFQVNDESIARHFHWLRDFALEHAEASAILAAID